jgi:putative ABC transport system substrate-binding protein
MLANRADPFHTLLIHNVQSAAERLALKLDVVLAQAGDDFDAHFSAIKAAGADAVLVQPTLPLREVAEAAVKARLPAAGPGGTFTRAGGLMSYSADVTAMQDLTVVIVDKVLKGRKPADLPVEIATRFTLTVNARAAEAIGLRLPAMLLGRADEVME